MEGFMVNTTNVNNCATDIQRYGKRVKDLQSSVRSIRSGMRHKLSAKGQIDKTLRGIEDRLLEEAAFMSSLDQALDHIAASYRRTERDLVIEGIRRSGNGKTVTEQQQMLMDQYMQAAIFDIMQEDQFSQEVWANASIEERKEILNNFLDRMEQEMGIPLDDIQFKSGNGLGYNGAYNYEDNCIILNEDLLTGDPGFMMTTLMHEGRHAYQHAVCENPDRFLVAEGTIQSWQDSFDHYQDYLERGDYYSIASEADAMGFAGQEQKVGEKVYFSDLKDDSGAVMYDKTYYADIYGTETIEGSGRASIVGYGNYLSADEAFIKQNDLKETKGILYDKYEGIVDGEEKVFYKYKWDDYAELKEGGRFGETAKVMLTTNRQHVAVIDNRELYSNIDDGSTKGNNNGKGGLMYRALGLLRDLDNWIVSSSLEEAKKHGPIYYWICKGFVGAYDPIGVWCDIGQGSLSGDPGMYMKGVTNMAMTSTDSDAANMIYGAADPMSWGQ